MLQVDAHQPVSDHRRSRCTGTALQVAAGLLDAGMPGGAQAVQLMLFVGGPCTEGMLVSSTLPVVTTLRVGPSKDGVRSCCCTRLRVCSGRAAMVSKELTREIRSHKDLEKDAAPLWRNSVQFYVDLAQTLVKNCVTLDVFACALEQSGLAEMKPAVQATGGLAVQTDTFRNPVFKDSLTRIFAKPQDIGFSRRCSCGTIEVHVSRDIKIAVCATLGRAVLILVLCYIDPLPKVFVFGKNGTNPQNCRTKMPHVSEAFVSTYRSTVINVKARKPSVRKS